MVTWHLDWKEKKWLPSFQRKELKGILSSNPTPSLTDNPRRSCFRCLLLPHSKSPTTQSPRTASRLGELGGCPAPVVPHAKAETHRMAPVLTYLLSPLRQWVAEGSLLFLFPSSLLAG